MSNLNFLIPVAILVMLVCQHSEARQTSAQNIEQCVPAWNQFSGTDKISSTIYSSVRGNDGLIYLGGRDGLYRIGGGSVKSWFPDFTDLNAIPSGHVKALAPDENYIWVGTNSGISRLNTVNGSVERNELVNKQSGYSPVNALVAFDGYLFVGTTNGGYVVSLANNIQDIALVQEFENTNALTSMMLFNNSILAAGKSGLWELSSIKPPEKQSLEAEDLIDITQIDGNIWVTSTEALYEKKVGVSEWNVYSRDNTQGLPDSEFSSLTKDTRGRLWIGAGKGLSRWNFAEPHPVKCRRGVLGSDRDQDITIAHLNGDLGDYMFLGSRGRGASFAPVQSHVRIIIPGGHYDSGLPSNSIWSHLIDQQGRFITGTSRGLFMERSKQSGYFEPVADSVLGNLRIYNLAEMPDGSLWIGTAKGLFIKRGDVVEAIPLLTNSDNEVMHPSVFSIKQHKGHIYVATSQGLVVLNADTVSLQALFKTKDKISGYTQTPELLLPVSRIWSVDFSGDRVFIAGQEGALEVDINNLKILSSTLAAQTQTRQPIGYIYNVTVVDDNRLFLGTEAGLIETNFDFSQYRKITQINGRQLTSVMSSGKDSSGNIWIGVAKTGLFKYQPRIDEWTHLTQSKGLITNGVSQLGLSFSNDGTMSVSNATGASVVNLDLLELEAHIPFTVHAVDLVTEQLFEQDEEYLFGPDERVLNLSFLATELLEPALYSVEYQLTSDDGTYRSATIPINEALLFVNLGQGAYQFSATVKSSSGATSPPIEFDFQVLPHWWETFVFKMAMVMALIMLITVYFYRRTKLIEQRLDIISDERKRIAQELHDTSLQDIFGAKMIGRTLAANLPDNQKDRVDRFLGLLDRSISSLRESVGSLNSAIHISNLSEAITELPDSLNLPEETGLHISESGNPWKLRECNRVFVYRIVREATNNAAKHAEADNINISVQWTRWFLSIVIMDDGKGFNTPAATDGNTYGLKSIRSMANSTRIGLDIDSEPEKGTRVTVKVPRIFF